MVLDSWYQSPTCAPRIWSHSSNEIKLILPDQKKKNSVKIVLGAHRGHHGSSVLAKLGFIDRCHQPS
jgi:hypothetical protein